jgi:high-affinity iron transporter
MGKNLFSVPIFFIVFRETLEAAIIVSVLLGLAEQIVHEDPTRFGHRGPIGGSNGSSDSSKDEVSTDPEDDSAHRRKLIRKLRIQVSVLETRLASPDCFRQIFAGAGLGLFLALAIGAALVCFSVT